MAKTILGVDIGYDSLKLALVNGKNVRKTAVVPMPKNLIREGRVVSTETMGELILRLHKKSNIEKMPITLRVLFTSGKEDPVGNYGAAPMSVYKEFLSVGMQKVKIKLYEGDRHEILNETDKDTVYEDIYNWLIEE